MRRLHARDARSLGRYVAAAEGLAQAPTPAVGARAEAMTDDEFAERYTRVLCTILEARDPRYSWSVIDTRGTTPRGPMTTRTPTPASASRRSSTVSESQDSAMSTGVTDP